jgi:hypothetical protein
MWACLLSEALEGRGITPEVALDLISQNMTVLDHLVSAVPDFLHRATLDIIHHFGVSDYSRSLEHPWGGRMSLGSCETGGIG